LFAIFYIFTGARAYELRFSCEISLFIYIYNEKKRGYLPMSARQKKNSLIQLNGFATPFEEG
jgi:hypothetical protein